jgi:DNA repair protein RAD5
MSYGDLEERPAKKRRFFVDDSPPPDPTLAAEPSFPDELNALPESVQGPAATAGPTDRNGGAAESVDGFDPSLLASFIGEQLPEPTIQRLKELSGNSIERGMFDSSTT